MLTLTFRAAKMARACLRSYEKFAKFKGGATEWGIDKPFPLLEVLDNNGLHDALWALHYCRPKTERNRIARLFACDCSERALPSFEKQYPEDKRPRLTIEVARRFTNGMATSAELAAAQEAAYAAVCQASYYAAVCQASYGTVHEIAYEAAYAAYSAVYLAGHQAFYSAFYSAIYPAVQSVHSAAYEAEKKWQEKHFREMISE